MNNLLDDYALMSPLRHRNTWLKLTIVASGLLIGVTSISPVTPVFIALCMSAAVVLAGRGPLSSYLKLILPAAAFAAVGSVIILFFFGSGTEVFSIGIYNYHLSATTGGVNSAVLVMARTISGMCCMFFLALSTPMVELFSVLKTSRLPDSLIELSILIYRYIFVLMGVAMSIKYAQTIRLGYKDFLTSLRSTAMLASALFIRSWEQGEKLYVSMDSRCYSGKLAVFNPDRPVHVPEIILACLYIIFITALSYSTKDLLIV